MVKTWKQTDVFLTSLKIKLSEELQDYKVKTVLENWKVTIFCLKGRFTGLQERKDYKSISKGEGESYLLFGVWTLEF